MPISSSGIYIDTYQDVYGFFPQGGPGGPVNFPASILDLQADLNLAGTWTGISGYVYSERAKPSITRGRPDESNQAVASSCVFQLNNRDNRFSTHNPAGAYWPSLTRNTPLRVSVPDSVVSLRLENDNTSWASCPSSSSINVAGDFEARIDLRLSNWTSTILASKGNTSGQYSWAWGINADGTLFWQYSSDGSTGLWTAVSSVPLPWPGGRISLKVTFAHSTGAVKFFWATSIGGTYTQLGTTQTTNAAAIFAGGASLKVGVDAFHAGLTGYAATLSGPAGQAWKPVADQGIQGRVYEFQLRSGIGGTLVANPVFTSQTAGATGFTDAESNSWTLQGTAELNSRRYRFHGEVAEWPPRWDPSGRDVYVTTQANGLLRRLQQNTPPLQSAYTRGWRTKTGIYAPLAYWPCEDFDGSTQLASGLATGTPMAIQGKTPTLAANSDFACSSALPQPRVGMFIGTVPKYTNPASSPANVQRMLVSVPSGGDTDTAIFARMYTTGTVAQVDLEYGVASSGSLRLLGYDASGSQKFDSGFVAFGINGVPSLVEMALTISGSTITWHINTLPVGAASQTGSSGTLSGSLGIVTRINIAPGSKDVESAIGQISVQSSYANMDTASSADALIGPLNAWAGETAGLRFARLCAEEGFACRIVGYPSTSVAMGVQTTGKTFMQLLQDCEDADHGMIFEPRSALALGYRTSGSMCNQALAISGALPVSLGYAAATMGGGGGMDIQPTDDDLLVINDEIVSRDPSGSSAEVAETGAAYAATGALSINAPPSGVGTYLDSRSVNVRSDLQLPDQAGWLVHRGTANELRYPAIPVDLARSEVSGVSAAVQDADLGDYLQIPDPPAWLSPDAARAIIWGTTESLGGYIFTLQFQTTPESPYETLVAGSGATSDCRADTDGSALHANITSSATSMGVDTTSGFPLWTTTAGDFPFDIVMGGERITVTNITGTSGTQTFTITRSVNGVVKAHTAGEAVSLFAPCYLALA